MLLETDATPLVGTETAELLGGPPATRDDAPHDLPHGG